MLDASHWRASLVAEPLYELLTGAVALTVADANRGAPRVARVRTGGASLPSSERRPVMQNAHPDSFRRTSTLAVGGRTYTIFRLDALSRAGFEGVARLPFSLKILLENLLRFEDGRSVTREDIAALASLEAAPSGRQGDRVPAGPRAAARLHRRPVRRRSGGDARRDGGDGRRPRSDQPAAAGRTRDRPLGAGRSLRHRRRVRAKTRSSNSSATASATRS